jgi:hypothetical protein
LAGAVGGLGVGSNATIGGAAADGVMEVPFLVKLPLDAGVVARVPLPETGCVGIVLFPSVVVKLPVLPLPVLLLSPAGRSAGSTQ